jgi:transcriptional regulator with XRE-family HTH domain
VTQAASAPGSYPTTRLGLASSQLDDACELVRRHRCEAGLSQNQLARLAGIDPAYINRIERKQHRGKPSRTVVLGLIDALDLDIDEGDRLLFAFGYAGQIDWQAAWNQVVAALPGAIKAAVERALADGLALAISLAEPAPPSDGST